MATRERPQTDIGATLLAAILALGACAPDANDPAALRATANEEAPSASHETSCPSSPQSPGSEA